MAHIIRAKLGRLKVTSTSPVLVQMGKPEAQRRAFAQGQMGACGQAEFRTGPLVLLLPPLHLDSSSLSSVSEF